jgi:hypothetical protein
VLAPMAILKKPLQPHSLPVLVKIFPLTLYHTSHEGAASCDA